MHSNRIEAEIDSEAHHARKVSCSFFSCENSLLHLKVRGMHHDLLRQERYFTFISYPLCMPIPPASFCSQIYQRWESFLFSYDTLRWEKARKQTGRCRACCLPPKHRARVTPKILSLKLIRRNHFVIISVLFSEQRGYQTTFHEELLLQNSNREKEMRK
jgi:hypothetical protein